MYQPYPSSPSQVPGPVDAEPPNSVRNAVRLMYAGAALSVVVVIVTLVTIASLKHGILSRHPDYTAAQRHNAEIAVIVTSVIGGLIAVSLWLWMAWANRRGRNWARIVSAVFFGINTLDLIISFTQVHVLASLIVSIIVWLVGLGAIILLFSKESGPYFARSASPPG
jgi:hypothetical protein